MIIIQWARRPFHPERFHDNFLDHFFIYQGFVKKRRRRLQAKRLKDKSYKVLEAPLRKEVIGWRQERGKRSVQRAWAAWWGAKVLHLKIYFFAKLFLAAKRFCLGRHFQLLRGGFATGRNSKTVLPSMFKYWLKQGVKLFTFFQQAGNIMRIKPYRPWLCELRYKNFLSTIFNPFCTDTFGKGRRVSQRFWRHCPKKMER